MPKIKSLLGLVKAKCLWEGCLRGKLLKGVKKARYLGSQEALAGKIVEIAQKVTPPTLLPKASLFNFDEYNFSMKSVNIRFLLSNFRVVESHGFKVDLTQDRQ
ncbi:MAG: hypothetical protein NT047_10225 [Deltaproteobacteria bacterium]|nr:hypothetical protein [Deltaproteobacteria bacterium]